MGSKALSDEIVTKAASNNGTLIGGSSLNGEIPSDSQYASYVTIKVQTVFDSNYTVEAKTRLAGVTGPSTWNTQVKSNIVDSVWRRANCATRLRRSRHKENRIIRGKAIASSLCHDAN